MIVVECAKIIKCSKSNPCYGDADCVDEYDGRTCHCHHDYTGTLCEYQSYYHNMSILVVILLIITFRFIKFYLKK